MIIKNLLPFLVVLAFSYTTTFAQRNPYPDSIKVEFPAEKSIVIFQLSNFVGQHSFIHGLPDVLKNIAEQVQNSLPSSEQANPHRVEVIHSQDGKLEGFVGSERFSPGQGPDKFRIEISQQPSKTSLTISGGVTTELLPPGWEMIIKGRDYIVSVYSPDLNGIRSLANLDFKPIITSIENDTKNSSTVRKGIRSRIIYEGGAVSHLKTDLAPIHDMIGLHAGAGVGLIRGNFYPELNFSTALYLANRHSVLRQRIEATYELKFFSGRKPEGGYTMHTNSFLNLSYSRNFSKDRVRWTGIGIGYLINSRGDIFQGKTLKFFLESDIGSDKINIVPEFYLTNDLKNFNFGLKLRYKF